ncbi:MAG: poly(3-hydroxybutyrate) depolymerase [Gammaproteobacteria bacterium]|jgi:poly(3-hydroxybutyrate) depolymerase
MSVFNPRRTPSISDMLTAICRWMAAPSIGFGAVSRARTVASFAMFFAVVVASSTVAAQSLSLSEIGARLALDPQRISLSGVSSGAYMAQQFHVAHSARIMGVGLVAGGPYRCAAGVYPPFTWLDVTGLYAATSKCSNTNPLWIYQGPPDVEQSVRETRSAVAAGAIDDPRGMRGDRVWLFSGGEDTTVPSSVVDALSEYYRHYVDVTDIDHQRIATAAHAMITVDFGNDCAVAASPYINDCDFDAAGRLLKHLLGALQPAAARADVHAAVAFDQAAFADPDAPSTSLHAVGHVYLPQQCRLGGSCRLHVAFHGCRQSQDEIDDAFYQRAGYNPWAESNGIVVLYPQATSWSGDWLSPTDANPNACWDWWGYSGNNYASRDGKQMRAVAAMINALLGAEVLKSESR